MHIDQTTPTARPAAVLFRLVPLVAAFTAMTLLAGCSQPEPLTPLPSQSTAPAESTPSPTSGAFSAPAPVSREEAIEAGARAYAFYLRTQAEVYAAPNDSSRITLIAIDPVATNVREFADILVRDGITADFSGTSFAPDIANSTSSSLQSVDGTVSEFGSVNLTGCLDTSKRVATLRDGSLDTPPEPLVYRVAIGLVYDHTVQQWFVATEMAENGAFTAC